MENSASTTNAGNSGMTNAMVSGNSATRRNDRRNNSRKNMEGGKRKRKASKWNLFTKKIFMQMKKKMGKKASFKMALKEASRRKREM